jgi:hypothetical protein
VVLRLFVFVVEMNYLPECPITISSPLCFHHATKCPSDPHDQYRHSIRAYVLIIEVMLYSFVGKIIYFN